MKEQEAAPKKPYEPPRIQAIKLAPEELASSGCKSLMIGPLTCNNAGIFVNRQSGS
jgi:hypothetical protein